MIGSDTVSLLAQLKNCVLKSIKMQMPHTSRKISNDINIWIYKWYNLYIYTNVIYA